ncbi:MAG: TRAM domain-containing protein [Armatimonadetes bacterium]|nr:TRAM domain-containing protein [Armatimonadota bacterium]
MGIIHLPENWVQLRIGLFALGSLVGIVAGLLLAPLIIRGAGVLTAFLEQYLQKTPLQDLLMGAVGLILGLIIANLLSPILFVVGVFGKIAWVLLAILLGYLGISIGIKKREEIIGLLGSFRLGKEKGLKGDKKHTNWKVLDTSVIIDGRIADLCESGFIEGTLLVPAFVLEELRHIADSEDVLKRNRGRRGLDILNAMRKSAKVKVQIYDNAHGPGDAGEVDTKLVKVAQRLGAKIITNDFNLNKVAELHGVGVLNINELANAVKPVVLPGEEMQVQVIKDGKEMGQGVAYLDDGTMIVIDGGKRYIGQSINVLVTSVLQTAAGRMIFARPRIGDRRDDHGSARYDEANMVG